MVPLCIFFAHHRNDPVTRHHLDILRRHNPADPIIPICKGASEPVEGALDVAKLSSDFTDEDKWLGSDTMLYLWFRHCRNVEAERYAVIEWDALATLPLREYYAEVWGADAAACQIKTPETTPHWDWFRLHGSRLPGHLRSYAAGLVPFNGTFLSRRAMERISTMEIPPNLSNELRLATLVKASGFSLYQLAEHKAANNKWRADLITIRGTPGVYHPVKWLLPPLRPETQVQVKLIKR